jgi:hypothetical protein
MYALGDDSRKEVFYPADEEWARNVEEFKLFIQ